MVIAVAPSLFVGDTVWVEHHVCGYVTQSNKRQVKPRGDVVPGTIRHPLFDGDSTVILENAVAGARIELWEQTTNSMLTYPVRAPFSDPGHVTFALSGFGQLKAGWKIVAKTIHCGQYVQTQPVTVIFRAPTLSSISPASVDAGNAAFVLIAKGADFRSGASVQWNSASRSTTFVSQSELHASIPATDISSVKSIPVRVMNPDGQLSGTVTFNVKAPAPPPVVGYDELVIQNCNTGTFPYQTTHRPIHIYFRLVETPRGPWIPIYDSPHNADYDANGHCPAPGSGAHFALDDGKTYEVVCTDWDLPGCMSSDPDELTCRKSSIITVAGKAGGGTKTIIVS